MNFKKLNIKIKYQSFIDSPLESFYIPVLSRSIEYKRAVGYFTSGILLDYMKGLKNFYKSKGVIRLIISPYLNKADIDSMSNVFNEEKTREILDDMFRKFLYQDDIVFSAGKLLFLLLKLNKIEIKVAEPKNTRGLFHDKIGIFKDRHNNKVAISGSNNETLSSLNFNIESFNTFCSWKPGQKEYVLSHELDFDNYWNGRNSNVKLYDLEQALSASVIKEFDTYETEEQLIDSIMEDDGLYEYISDNDASWSVTPYDFQKDAVEKWFKNDKKGIFKFATGTGKTKTAIYLMERLEKLSNKNFFVIVVPDKTLVKQWSDELDDYNKRTLRCYSENSDWTRDFKNLIDMSSVRDDYQYYIVVTNHTYRGKSFQEQLDKLNNNYTLVVDECHSWGSNLLINNLPNPKRRLGLSATPELYFSERKTDILLNFFGGIVAEYSLERAIEEKRLVGYYYYPHVVSFTCSEKQQYEEETKKIVRMIGRDVDQISDKISLKHQKILEQLLFRRARILYGARNKLVKLEEIVYPLAQQKNLLIYCGPTSYSEDAEGETLDVSLTQLEEVNKLLNRMNIKAAQYTSQENEFDRKIALDSFKTKQYSALVAIKCLDEGINIPQIERAVILASSTNPREFVQRRGRILRTNIGKEYAEIHDFILLDNKYSTLMKNEIKRLYEFAKIAINKQEIFEEYKDEIERYIKGEENE